MPRKTTFMIHRETHVVNKAKDIPTQTRSHIRNAENFASNGDHVNAARLYLEVAQLMLDTDDFRRAEAQYNKATEQAKKAGNPNLTLRLDLRGIAGRLSVGQTR